MDELDDDKKQEKLKHSLLKYASRISSRSTPFGMFSGLQTLPLGQDEDTTPIQIGSKEQFKGFFRLDINFSNLYASLLNKSEVIRKYIKFYPNTSLYSLGNQYRLVTYEIDENARKYDLISVEKDDWLVWVIDESKKGVYLSELIKELVSEGIDEEEAKEYIFELVDSQLIVSQMELSMIGEETEFQLLSQLKRIQEICDDPDREIINQNVHYLERIISQLNALGNAGSDTESYNQLVEFIKTALPFDLKVNELDEKYLIQCNMNIEFDQGVISQNQLKMIEKAKKLVNHFYYNEKSPEPKRMKKFREEFERRYEGKMVPLVEALDVETGIGYGTKMGGGGIDVSPILNDIAIGRRRSLEEKMTWNRKITPFWLDKIMDARQDKTLKIELTDNDLLKFTEAPIDHSTTYIAKVGLYKKEEEDVLLFDFYGGGTATAWFGRFCNGNESVNELVQEISTYEAAEQDHVIVAEINHLPESRLGNVIQRPEHRKYQINYLAGYNSTKNDEAISIEDLMLGMEEGKMILVSKKHNKKVFTYHSNAYNASLSSNLPLFQFLADLEQINNQNGFGLDLNFFHRFSPFIPRVQYGNIILQRASWKFKRSDFKSLQKSNDLVNDFKVFSKEHALPQYLVLKQRDNELLIDTENIESLKILLKEAKKRGVQLVEFMLNEFESAIKNKSGEQFNNEVLVSYGMPVEKKRNYDFTSEFNYQVQDSFSPGSEWLYYKIYLGVKSADKLLLELEKITNRLKQKGKIDHWFFIRYYDTKEHVRFRLHINDMAFLGNVIQELNAFFDDFQKHYQIDNIILDTYKRELSRYGYDEIESFEKIFHHDSVMCARLINHFNAYNCNSELWLAGLYSMNAYCDLFRLSEDRKIKFLEKMEEAFRKEFMADSVTTKSIGKQYNTHKQSINELFIEQKSEGLYQFIEIIEERNRQCLPIVDGIFDRNPNAGNYFLHSVIHMNINRLFRSKQRLYEFLCYSFLKKITTTLKYVKPSPIEKQVV